MNVQKFLWRFTSVFRKVPKNIVQFVARVKGLLIRCNWHFLARFVRVRFKPVARGPRRRKGLGIFNPGDSDGVIDPWVCRPWPLACLPAYIYQIDYVAYRR